MSDKITVRLRTGERMSFTGRAAWALRKLIEAGHTGFTTIDHPAPRLSHYIFLLRKGGLVISTEHEPHKGDFPGTHGRYRLGTPVTIETEALV